MPESSNSNEYLMHFCYLFCKLLREKPRDKWLWPIYALFILLYPTVQEINSRHWAKKKNKKKVQKGRKMKLLASNSQWRVAKASKGRKAYSLASNSQWRVAKASKGRKAYSLASNSPPTRNGEWSKSQQRQKHSFARHGECIYLRGELGRLNSSKMM